MTTTPENHAPENQALPPDILANFYSPDFIRDPYETLEKLRERTSAFYEPVMGRTVLLGWDDIETALRDRTYSRDPRNAAEDTLMARLRGQDERPGTSILFLDPPDHTRLRGLVNKAFTPRAVEAMRPRIEAIAEDLLDKVEGKPTWDLIEAFAAPLPTIVIAEMLGVDPKDQPQFKAWSDNLVKGLDPFISPEDQQRLDESRAALDAYLRAQIAGRRAQPRDDLLSALIVAEDEGHKLTEDELLGTVSLLLVAGNVTTTDLIGNGVHALLRHPDQKDLLRDDPSLIVNAVEEMLRYDSPVVLTGRIVMDDEVVTGCPVKKGHSLTPLLAAANHDPAVHADPHRFDIAREDPKHQSFGGGAHYCLGAPLARAEAQVAVTTLLRRFPNLHLAGPEPERRLLIGFRGFLSLPVAVD
ncbi:MAG: cytochrome P450 [Dehalococcoidia bacterium]|nr:cytochrome P450 [Dehalococcoidia bacterium]